MFINRCLSMYTLPALHVIISILIVTKLTEYFCVLQTSVTDVLHALGAVPSGFRPSTLGPKFHDGRFILVKHHYMFTALMILCFSLAKQSYMSDIVHACCIPS